MSTNSLRVPDNPSVAWALKVAERLVSVVGNTIAIEASQAETAEVKGEVKKLGKNVEKGSVDLALIGKVINAVVKTGRTSESARPSSIDDYAALFKVLALPLIASDYNQDATFAAMRLAGLNPVMISRVDSRGAVAMPLTDAQYQSVKIGDTIDAAVGAGRLFQCDYSALRVLNDCAADGSLRLVDRQNHRRDGGR